MYFPFTEKAFHININFVAVLFPVKTKFQIKINIQCCFMLKHCKVYV